MKRHLLTLVLSGLVGSLVLAGNAEACPTRGSVPVVHQPPARWLWLPPAPLRPRSVQPTCAPRNASRFVRWLQGIQAWLPQEGPVCACSRSPL